MEKHMLSCKEYHTCGWRLFVLFYVQAWKTHSFCHLNTRYPFLPCPGGLRSFAFAVLEFTSHRISLFHLFSTLHSAVRVQLVCVDNVTSVWVARGVLRHQIRKSHDPETTCSGLMLTLSLFSLESPTAHSFCHTAFRFLHPFLWVQMQPLCFRAWLPPVLSLSAWEGWLACILCNIIAGLSSLSRKLWSGTLSSPASLGGLYMGLF